LGDLEYPDTSHKKIADAFPSYSPKFILQGGFASQAFSNQKKGNFQAQILNVHIFSPIEGVTYRVLAH
jgi:hypothetical protein